MEDGETFSIADYLINILICSVLLYILSRIYIKYGNSLSNRHQLSRVLVIVGVTTFIIISIVKSSLALSLGLVGALSIIRFRTAIKEPEELGYFFIAIAIGLGLGANQLLPTVIGFIIISVIILLLGYKKLSNLNQNVLITLKLDQDKSESAIDQIASILTNNTEQLELKRFKNSNGVLNLNFLISIKHLESINRINSQIQERFGAQSDITFIDNQI